MEQNRAADIALALAQQLVEKIAAVTPHDPTCEAEYNLWRSYLAEALLEDYEEREGPKSLTLDELLEADVTDASGTLFAINCALTREIRTLAAAEESSGGDTRQWSDGMSRPFSIRTSRIAWAWETMFEILREGGGLTQEGRRQEIETSADHALAIADALEADAPNSDELLQEGSLSDLVRLPGGDVSDEIAQRYFPNVMSAISRWENDEEPWQRPDASPEHALARRLLQDVLDDNFLRGGADSRPSKRQIDELAEAVRSDQAGGLSVEEYFDELVDPDQDQARVIFPRVGAILSRVLNE